MALRLVEHSRVSPPLSSSPRPSLPFTMFDIPWLNLGPVERLFFFRFPHSTSHFLDVHLPILKSSLSITLELFYPLAGSYRCSPENRFEIHYSDGDAVSLTVNESLDLDFHDIAGHHARSVDKLLLLVPNLPISPDSQPLLALQLTLFPGQGLCLALTVHHAACDGFSSIHFVKYWAAACRAAGSLPPSLPPPPFLDRSVIADPRGVYWKLSEIFRSPKTSWENPITRRGNSGGMACATFTLGAPQIARLKQLAQEGKPEFHCSTFVVACAYAWVCHVKSLGFDEDRVAYLLFPMDWRQRIRPRIPPNYFGNCLGSACQAKKRVSDITGEDGVLVACEAIEKCIEDQPDDVSESLERLFLLVREASLHQPRSLAGSPRLRVYETDLVGGSLRR
ncbi:hypothetical protein HPP92_012583 [Vanilla planifolia]|uniref:Uncharacterized protein n=1 Tax=Vanilla planifolia TaxID=51239 RepID=A0A835UVY5_VANPL|nr:hypothetical protein HPP92_012583 [Vanilla planifolia]